MNFIKRLTKNAWKWEAMEDKDKMGKTKFDKHMTKDLNVNRKTMHMISLKTFSLKVAIVFAFALSFFAAQTVLAAGDAGGGNNLGGSCYGSGTSWNSSCYGATWRYYPFGSQSQTFVNGVLDSNNQAVNGNANAPGGSIASGSGTGTGCEEVGGVYILGLEQYNPQTQQSLGYQFGIVQSGQLATQGGYINFRDDIAGSSSLSTVQNAFNAAKAAGVTGNQEWDDTLGWFCYNPELEGLVPDEPETPPAAQLDADILAQYWTTSGVKTVPSGDVSQIQAETDGSRTGLKARIKFSTDGATASVVFTHKIYHAGSNGPLYPGVDYEKDENPPTSPLCVTGTVSGGAGGASGQHCDSDGTTTIEVPYTFSLSYDSPVEVCSTISISAQLMGYKATAKTRQVRTGTDSNGNPTYRTERYNSWSGPLSAGSFQSEACAWVVRPSNPAEPGNGGNDPVMKGDTAQSILYSEETAEPTWKHAMTTWSTRRHIGHDAVLYQINVQAPASSRGTYVSNDPKAPAYGALCDRFSGMNYVYGRCVAHASDRVEIGGDRGNAQYNGYPQTVVPYEVGDKYCNSFGFKIGYWYAYDNGSGNYEWKHETDKDYWAVYPSSCRTIAKKPSIAVWNGGVHTQGSVDSVTSPRYIDQPFAKVLGDGNDLSNYRNFWSNYFGFHDYQDNDDDLNQFLADNSAGIVSGTTTFGSWVEYLLNVNNRIGTFASAAAFARGSDSGEAAKISTLTISNTNPQDLGRSGVGADSTFRNRLVQYFYDKATGNYEDAKNQGILRRDITESHILIADGDITIENDIKLADRTYGSIYELPQVVIYAKGNINIDSRVKRVDAWLISKNGKVNTCASANGSQFIANSTETDASDVRSGQTPFRGAACTNQLMVNGPIIANGMVTNRSYGSDPDSKRRANQYMPANSLDVAGQMERYTPAEIFNLRADNYLWAYAQAGRYDSSYTEAYTRELAPRY